ncbi:hypothetical protein BS78_09G122700 [Paspalum vaginatum]|nr:hypothetical protein BS78_09G122700 [Paspalum vaginatum]
MASGNSTNKRKAVDQEEVPPPMPVAAFDQEEVSPLMPATQGRIAHHQGFGTRLRRREVGSTSSAPNMTATAAGGPSVWPVPLPLAMAAPVAATHQSQQLDKHRIAYIKIAMQQFVAAMDAANIVEASSALLTLSLFSSPNGDPIQRVTSAFTAALGRRALGSLWGLSLALQHQIDQPPTAPAQALTANAVADARRVFHTMSPLLRGAAVAANHAIFKAVEAETTVHLVDLGGASPSQWLDLLRLLAARPGGPPALRLTVVSDQDSFLSGAGELLRQEAARLHVPFLFNPVRSCIDQLSGADIAALGVKPGQPLVVSSTLQLHRLIDATSTVVRSVTAEHTIHHVMPKVDALLQVLHMLSPKLFVVTEQDADHNCTGLWDRVRNAFDHYLVLFNDMEVCEVPRESPARVAVEQLVLREEIMDIVARDGTARRERHESMMRWFPRMHRAGFQLAPVSTDGVMESLPGNAVVNPMYRVRKVNGCFLVYSCGTSMFAVSVWRPRRR